MCGLPCFMRMIGIKRSLSGSNPWSNIKGLGITRQLTLSTKTLAIGTMVWWARRQAYLKGHSCGPQDGHKSIMTGMQIRIGAYRWINTPQLQVLEELRHLETIHLTKTGSTGELYLMGQELTIDQPQRSLLAKVLIGILMKRCSFFGGILLMSSALSVQSVAAQQLEKDEAIHMKPKLFEDMKLAEETKHSYLDLIRDRLDCGEDEAQCQWEIVTIMVSWLGDPALKKMKGYDQPFMFRHLRMALNTKLGRSFQDSPLIYYYGAGWGGLPKDIELSECWSLMDTKGRRYTVDDCEALEAKKFGKKNPWLYLTEKFPKLEFPGLR
jgi:hypothetical protein